MGDFLGVVAKADQLGGQITFGLDPDRAIEALVGKEIAAEIVSAGSKLLDARAPQPLDAASRIRADPTLVSARSGRSAVRSRHQSPCRAGAADDAS